MFWLRKYSSQDCFIMKVTHIYLILVLALSSWLGWLTYTKKQNQLTSNQLVSQSGKVLLDSEKLFNALLNIETTQRGYRLVQLPETLNVFSNPATT